MLEDYESLNHEMIHFFQGLELLFVFHWILYVFFHFRNLIKGMSWYESYKENPFEREAYRNEADMKYLFRRKAYSWFKYI